jgi:hypothetical protein
MMTEIENNANIFLTVSIEVRAHAKIIAGVALIEHCYAKETETEVGVGWGHENLVSERD